ncbi:unknown [[Mannheimia] succiniciproducens MBEL55E]|uniref:Uncharacterized protein n=1 Tax=Mannheimia succiniciproducens (strain KCTC 0769BP / MBEL55E) TaxID=221988 RepID=Q65TM8_MANSM|nr:unknown [[Mannheimia] succiniciproducens MBEL55E]
MRKNRPHFCFYRLERRLIFYFIRLNRQQITF